jgi:DNA repair protein RecO (recombination protein O)
MLVATPAVILQAFPYGDTSRIVRLATRDLGVQSVIAKGALRPRSRFGGRLQLLTVGVAQFHHRANRDLHTLTAFDVTAQHMALTADLRRFAAAAALAELVLRTAQEEPQSQVYDTVVATLEALAAAVDDHVHAVALAGLWRAVVLLGFAPTADECVRCGRPLGERAAFALPEGGLLCPGCGTGGGTGALSADDQDALRAFLMGDAAAGGLPPRHLAAHRRLFARFVRRHVADDTDLPALRFWEALP